MRISDWSSDVCSSDLNFSSAPDGLSKTRLSTAIAVARVLCIFEVVYVHAWTGLDGGRLTLADSSTQGVFRWVLMELLGRSAVPLLGMISGWLVAGSASHRTYGAFIGGKTDRKSTSLNSS